MARPLSGLPYMAPFRTVQYRFHPNTPVHFEDGLDFQWERGPHNNSHGWLESVSYYYLESPAASGSDLSEDRRPPPDSFEVPNLMRELANMERMGDLLGPQNRIDEFLSSHTNYAGTDLLRLRHLAYQQRHNDRTTRQRAYDAFTGVSTNQEAVMQAKQLRWFNEDPAHALLVLYSNARSTIFVDGRRLAEVDHPERMFALPLKLNSGEHTLCIESRCVRYRPWVAALLRTHEEDFGSDTTWRYAVAPSGGYRRNGFDDTGWHNADGGFRGPPEAPYLLLAPNAYINVQSTAEAMTIPHWRDRHGTNRVVFRKTFSIASPPHGSVKVD